LQNAEIDEMMHWDSHLDDAQIQVDVNGNRVPLSGQVPSAAEKSRAIRLAWVTGVSDVDATGLQVAGGKVVLKGTVDTYLEKAQGDDVAAQVRGVRSVYDKEN